MADEGAHDAAVTSAPFKDNDMVARVRPPPLRRHTPQRPAPGARGRSAVRARSRAMPFAQPRPPDSEPRWHSRRRPQANELLGGSSERPPEWDGPTLGRLGVSAIGTTAHHLLPTERWAV